LGNEYPQDRSRNHSSYPHADPFKEQRFSQRAIQLDSGSGKAQDRRAHKQSAMRRFELFIRRKTLRFSAALLITYQQIILDASYKKAFIK
jgi:hypothetical protein